MNNETEQNNRYNTPESRRGEYGYLNLLRRLLHCGRSSDNRTGVSTRKVIGEHLMFDLDDGFPLLTTKKLHLKSIIHELLWFMSGSTNIKYLQDNGVTIWDEWADKHGDVGPLYGHNWRSFSGHFDQIERVVNTLLEQPESRWMHVSAWDPTRVPVAGKSFEWNWEAGNSAIPPCHYGFTLITERIGDEERKQRAMRDGIMDEAGLDNYPTYFLHLKFNMRSTDVFLGLPFNIASYALLLMMFAKRANMIPREVHYSGDDVHLYDNHREQALEQCSRVPRALPKMVLVGDVGKDMDDYVYDDFKLEGYDPHPVIKAPIAV